MPALSDLPELVGFFSYSREDDEDFDHSLSKLRTRIQNELRGQLGRSREALRLWQDREAIPPGTLWASEIEAAIGQSVFFIPIVSPRVVRSEYCGTEFQRFLQRERLLGRRDLVFPVLFINVPELTDAKPQGEHSFLNVIAERQYVDWREFRYDPDSPVVRRQVADFCAKIATALRRISAPEENDKRRASEADQARRRQAEDQERREAEAKARAEEAMDRQHDEAVARSQREAAAEHRAQAAQPAAPHRLRLAGQDPDPMATAARADQYQPEPSSKWSRAIGAMLIILGGIEGALATTFSIKIGQIDPILSGLLILDIATIAIGIGTIQRSAWPTLPGIAISILGSANGLFWFCWGLASDKPDTSLFIAWPYAVSTIVYIAGIRYFLTQLRNRSGNKHKTGV